MKNNTFLVMKPTSSRRQFDVKSTSSRRQVDVKSTSSQLQVDMNNVAIIKQYCFSLNNIFSN